MSSARRISEAVSEKLKGAYALSKLTEEELLDVQKMVQMADYMLAKHEHKKQVRSLLSEFVDSMRKSAQMIDEIDDDIQMLSLTAEDSIRNIRDIQARLDGRTQDASGINLTKSSSAVY